MTEPISDEDLAKFREVHQRTGDPEMGPDRCIEGRWVTWPCASVAVLARLDAAESRARDAEGERELYDTAVAQANYWVRGYKDAFDKLAEDAEATITSLRLQVEEGERERERKDGELWEMAGDRARLIEALRKVDAHGCTNLTAGRCSADPSRTSDSPYGATRWCDACIAAAALAPIEGDK